MSGRRVSAPRASGCAFEKLSKSLDQERSRSHSPLFQVVFASLNTPEKISSCRACACRLSTQA
jgi:hypothetical protein